MKAKLALILLLFVNLLFSQTLELEKENLNRAIRSGKFDQYELKRVSVAWDNLLAEFGGYTELPYNPETKRIEYIKIENHKGIQKEHIYKRVKEWIAINYGSISDVLHYEDYESGKIIVKGWSNLFIEDILAGFWGNPQEIIRSLKCYHTAIFTIKDEKTKIEFTNIEYESESGGYTLGNTFLPVSKIKYSIKELYPITTKDKSTWISRLSTLSNTTIEINVIQKSVKSYIESFPDDQKF